VSGNRDVSIKLVNNRRDVRIKQANGYYITFSSEIIDAVIGCLQYARAVSSEWGIQPDTEMKPIRVESETTKTNK